MNRLTRSGLLLATVLILTPPSRAGDAAPSPTPAPLVASHEDRFQFAYETAVNFGINNPNDYIINPSFFSLRWQPRKTQQFFHTPFTFTQQFELTAAVVPFWRGAENYYFGAGVGTRLLYSMPGSRWSIFVGGRLYVGTTDSTGAPHGLGEDLTFSPTVSGGLLYQVSGKQRIGLSLLYEHFSNAGLSEPEVKNVGLNTVGPMLEWNYSF